MGRPKLTRRQKIQEYLQYGNIEVVYINGLWLVIAGAYVLAFLGGFYP